MDPIVKPTPARMRNVPVHPAAGRAAVTEASEVLMVGVLQADGERTDWLGFEIVTVADLAPARDSVWWTAVRRGQLPPDFNALSMRLRAGKKLAGPACEGFSLELAAGEDSFRRRFSIHHLAPVAQRAVDRLTKDGVLADGDKVSYLLAAQPKADVEQALTSADRGESAVRVKARHEPIVLETASLADYLAASEPLLAGQAAAPDGAVSHMPAFVPPDVWEQGRKFARRGEEKESAAVWTGRLMRDAASPEVFAVIDACIDAQHAEEEKYSVTFSSDTWRQVCGRLEQRRRRLGRPHELILGSVHGHNFAPSSDEEGRKMCDECEKRAACTRTTAVASRDDGVWHAAIFSAQPFALMTVWGWSARDEEVWQTYSLADGSLVSRPLRMLRKGS